MKTLFISLLLLFLSLQSYGQDSIVNYIDVSGKKVKKNKAFSVETEVKKDSVWKYTQYYRSRRIKLSGQFKNKNKKKPVGTFYKFFRNGDLKNVYSYDNNGNLSGNTKKWFDNNGVSYVGNYQNGNKVGIWKYYHYNGKIACKQYYQNFKVVKTLFYNDEGEKIDANLIQYQAAKFEGGDMDKFLKRIKDVHSKLGFQIQGNVFLNFTIGIDGRIRDFSTTDKIPIELERRLRIYFEGISGWEPSIHMNRKVPVLYVMPMDFFVTFGR